MVIFYKMAIRKFKGGANRDSNKGKYEYARFLSPQVIQRFAKYMDKHRTLPDGSLREPDNWKKGMPKQVLIDSKTRHDIDIWLIHETGKSIRPETNEEITFQDALCGAMFNIMALLHQDLK